MGVSHHLSRSDGARGRLRRAGKAHDPRTVEAAVAAPGAMPLLRSSCVALTEFATDLTVLVPSDAKYAPRARAVLSSGGVADGVVVSEGMGYGLLLAGVALASEPRDSECWRKALSLGEELFAGWRLMCERTRNSCQAYAPAMCGGRVKRTGEPSRGTVACLPAWQFDVELRRQRSSGSAADADEDALLGLVLMVEATDAAAWPSRPAAQLWAYETARAFLQYNTAAAGAARLTRLGSCWGGWDCNNPSYLAPAHYRAFRAFMLRHAKEYGKASEASAAAGNWDALVRGSYAMLRDAQCAHTGLTPNWWQPAGPQRPRGAAGCNSSGTSADEFGAEASRGVWRVALDALWTPAPWAGEAPPPSWEYSRRVGSHLVSKLNLSDVANFSALDAGCAVASVHAGWQWQGFIYGPLSAALMLPLETEKERQKKALAALAAHIGAAPRRDRADYYHGSWLAIATVTLNGDLGRACARLLGADNCPAAGEALTVE